MGTADEVRRRIAVAWQGFRGAIAGADLDLPTSAGWAGKEMLAHASFWLETVPPFVTGAFRGDARAFQHVFPSGFDAGQAGDWPPFEVHNQREAAWGRSQPAGAVLARADAAYDRLVEFLATVTDEEATEHATYFGDVAGHLDEHRSEFGGQVPPDR